MGSACIKVTKYFLFLFNLIFFVSMSRAVLTTSEKILLPGASQPDSFQSRLGCGLGGFGGWGLRMNYLQWNLLWVARRFPGIPSWSFDKALDS